MWHTSQLPGAVFHATFVVALWHEPLVHVPNVPPPLPTASVAGVPLYVSPPRRFTVPSACALAVSAPAAWQSAHRYPTYVTCGAWLLVTSVPLVELWHSVHVLVPPIAVFQTYPGTAAAPRAARCCGTGSSRSRQSSRRRPPPPRWPPPRT